MSLLMRRRHVVLVVLLVILSLSIYASSISRLAFGDISIKKQDILRGNGRVVSFRDGRVSKEMMVEKIRSARDELAKLPVEDES